MNFPDDAPVTPAKKAALRARMARLGIDVARVSMTATKGSGAGGQKRNKTSSGVMLATEHLGRPYQARCTESRGQALNRFLALRQLVDDIEEVVSPQTSERLAERERQRKQKDRRRRRAVGAAAHSVAATGDADSAHGAPTRGAADGDADSAHGAPTRGAADGDADSAHGAPQLTAARAAAATREAAALAGADGARSTGRPAPAPAMPDVAARRDGAEGSGGSTRRAAGPRVETPGARRARLRLRASTRRPRLGS